MVEILWNARTAALKMTTTAWSKKIRDRPVEILNKGKGFASLGPGCAVDSGV